MGGSVKALLDRVRKLERSTENTGELREIVSAYFADAIFDGRICPIDGPVVLKSVLQWIDEGSVRPI